MITALSRLIAMAGAGALTLALAVPAHADPAPPLPEGAKAAVASVDPALKPGETKTQTVTSDLDSSQKVKIEDALFTAGDEVLGVVRSVGAVRAVGDAT